MLLTLAEPLMQEPTRARSRKAISIFAPLSIFGCTLLIWNHRRAQQMKLTSTSLFGAPAMGLKARIAQSVAKVAGTAKAGLLAQSHSSTSPIASQAYMMGARLAAQDGARVGCRGSLTCMAGVGLFYGTQTGRTETVAGTIADVADLEATDISEVSASDLAGYDGLIVGAPTWHTGADEQRSGTTWDDYLDDIKGLDLCGKPVAVFGVGDSMGYGDNFCDAIEELHSTFAAAGAKMLGYVADGDYSHTESKSVSGGKFLGLPLDEDNEDDKTESRVDAWVKQLQSEGMPISR